MGLFGRPVKSVRVDSPCPSCHQTGTLTLLTLTVNVPYFGDGLESTLRCEGCGFRHADFMILGQKDPVRLEFRAETESDLQVRVIRSHSGTIRIPELGFTAEPTPLSESFVSNVEGVLERAKRVLLTTVELNRDDPAKIEILTGYLDAYTELSTGRRPCTIILDDPFGNSAIVDERVQRRLLTEDEVASLKTGVTIIDASDLA